jgi:ribosomal protein S14
VSQYRLIYKDNKWRQLVARAEFYRFILIAAINDLALPKKFRIFLYYRLLCFNAKKFRYYRSMLHARCVITGKSRFLITYFGISRFQFKKMAAKGYLIGVERISW